MLFQPCGSEPPGLAAGASGSGVSNEADLEHGAQRIFLPQLLGNPPLLQPEHGCPCELHFAARGGRNRTHAEVAEGRTRMRAAAFPPADDVVAFGDEVADTAEIQVGKRIAKFRHEIRNRVAAFFRLMHRVVHQYVRRGEFVDDCRIPRVSPEFLEPPGHDFLVVL